MSTLSRPRSPHIRDGDQLAPANGAPSGAPAPGVLPATGVVLIGCARTIPDLARGVAAAQPGCVVAGCVLLDRFAGIRAPETGDAAPAPQDEALPPLLGFVKNLVALHARHQFRFALVSAPAVSAASWRPALKLLAYLEIPTRVITPLADAVLGMVGPGASHETALVPPLRLARDPGTPQTAAARNAAAIVETPASLHVAPDAAPPARPARREVSRALDIFSLIGRSQARTHDPAIAAILTGKRILITGAGGSIGSELARFCARFAPAEIVLMERAENALFQVDHDLGRQFPALPRRAVLHDVNDADETLRMLLRLRPHVVFHAAAHKHVPLMEDHPALAVGNNLFATKSIADAAVACGAERFVMISSDKAVNPTSVMGATKRLAERYVAALAPRARGMGTGAAGEGGTRLSMVRFGNVLASACSVIPIWSQQLADGGPLTVTDPRMTRYFMTIPEAAALVVQAAALDQPASAAPVYVLDMGEPVNILDLAQRFARLHGYAPQVDWSTAPAGSATAHEIAQHTFAPNCAEAAGVVTHESRGACQDAVETASLNIVFTGARPGEKLFEQLAYDAEQLAPTAHEHINQWSFEVDPEAPGVAQAMVADLMPMRSASAEKRMVLERLRHWVPELPKG
ncbi:hypothetical protein BH11PLA1_BH11PLA1_15940 [soil metagenome]